MLKVEKVQKRFTKMIEGYETKSYEQRLIDLRITTLEERFYRADMIQVFKILNDNRNIFPINFLELSNRAGRNNSLKLFKRRSNGDISKYCFASRVVDLWNDLPDAVVLSADVNVFKDNLDKCITPLAKSDHNVLNIVLNVTVRAKSTVVKSYSYNKANYKTLEVMLNKEDWEDVIRKMSVNEVWETIKNYLNVFKEKCIPQFSRSSSNDVPWLNDKLKALIRSEERR